MKTKTITADELDRLAPPTLEDILALVNGGKYGKFFLKKAKVYDNYGAKECLTKKGSILYHKLTSILFACRRLTKEDSVSSMVDELDSISNEEC